MDNRWATALVTAVALIGFACGPGEGDGTGTGPTPGPRPADPQPTGTVTVKLEASWWTPEWPAKPRAMTIKWSWGTGKGEHGTEVNRDADGRWSVTGAAVPRGRHVLFEIRQGLPDPGSYPDERTKLLTCTIWIDHRIAAGPQVFVGDQFEPCELSAVA